MITQCVERMELVHAIFFAKSSEDTSKSFRRKSVEINDSLISVQQDYATKCIVAFLG